MNLNDQINACPCLSKQFGSWAEALRKARINPDKHLAHKAWNANRLSTRLSTELTKWVAKNGPLNAKNLKQTHHALFSALARACGSVRKAADRFKLPYRPSRVSLRRKEVLAGIQARQAKGKALGSVKVLNEDGTLFRAARKVFGNWSNALKTARVGFDPVAKRRKAAREELK